MISSMIDIITQPQMEKRLRLCMVRGLQIIYLEEWRYSMFLGIVDIAESELLNIDGFLVLSV